VFQASIPPEEEYLTPLLVLKDVCDVEVLVIPVVVLPLGSSVAKQNSISVSAATDKNAAGVLTVSRFCLLKSSFNISFCYSICLLLIFSLLL
jgi:hypothetical protein